MNLTHLRCFAVVAHEQSITRAAQILYISQPAVSKMIRQLESELNVQLFTRTGRTIRLNRAGNLFYSYVSDSLAELERGVTAVSGGVDQTEHPIELTLEVASALIPQIVTTIQTKFPNVRLNLKQHSVLQFDQTSSDFIITSRHLNGYTSVPILQEEILVGWQPSTKTSQRVITTADLKHQAFVGLTPENALRKTVDQYFETRQQHLNYMYEADDPATVRGLINAGVGYGFIPAVTWQATGRNLHVVHLAPDALVRTIYLSSPQGKQSSLQREIGNELIRLFVKYQVTALTV